MRTVVDPESVDLGLRRVAGEILERHRDSSQLVLVGVRRGGIPVARRLAQWLERLEGHSIRLGSVDITFYRDDAATALPNPRTGPSDIPVSLDNQRVILVDDVVFTGRTIRAALDALLDYGRPERIELAAVVDRGGRQLPIQPDYVVRTLQVQEDERVDVVTDTSGIRVIVQSFSSPSIPPPPAP
jgi:pyrimidine operon attenuation protein/uracil phosphoribosyltransferase